MTKEELLKIRNIIEDIKNKGVNEEYIKELYKILGNDSIPIIFTNLSPNPASFTPKHKTVLINMDRSKDWVKKVSDEFLTYFDVSDLDLFKSYLLVGMLGHEVEHSNQKLIADGLKNPKFEYQIKAYHDVYEIMKSKRYILPRPISLTKDIIRFLIYKKNAYDFILERNASVEGYNVAAMVASEAKDSEISQHMISTRNTFMLQGYSDGCDGTLKYTYRKLGMIKDYNKLVFPKGISLDEKMREGLELSEKERNKAIKVLKQSIKYK